MIHCQSGRRKLEVTLTTASPARSSGARLTAGTRQWRRLIQKLHYALQKGPSAAYYSNFMDCISSQDLNRTALYSLRHYVPFSYYAKSPQIMALREGIAQPCVCSAFVMEV